MPLPVEIVAEPAQLADAVGALRGSRVVALDTESNGFHHYPEQLCLIQIASVKKVYIIDAIALRDLGPLRDILENACISKVVHSADYDIRSLDRHSGLHIRNLSDTSIAARFIGMTQLGLASLAQELLGVSLNKSKLLQRSNWGLRPLSAEAVDYAAGDVSYLIALWDVLERRLCTLGREAWVAEENSRMEDVRYVSPDVENAFLSVKGSRDLDGRGLAVLRKLCQFREQEALCQRRPPFYILPDSTLVFLAADPQADLSRTPGLGQVGLNRFGRRLQQALCEGLSALPVQRPPRAGFVRPDAREVSLLRRLKEWRASLGSGLSLDPSLIWPMASLERLAHAPATMEAEIASDGVRAWQRDVFAASLRACLSSA